MFDIVVVVIIAVVVFIASDRYIDDLLVGSALGWRHDWRKHHIRVLHWSGVITHVGFTGVTLDDDASEFIPWTILARHSFTLRDPCLVQPCIAPNIVATAAPCA